MAFGPIAHTIPQYEDFPNFFLKAFKQGTTTPVSSGMAVDKNGGGLATKFELNNEGFPKSSGGALIIPFIDEPYDLWLFPTAVEADNNDTSNAKQFGDDLTAPPPFSGLIQSFDTLAIAAADLSLSDGDSIYIKERATFDAGGGDWDVVLTLTTTPNTFNIVVGTGISTLSLVNVPVDEVPSVSQWGGIGDGTTENAPLFTIIEATAFSDVYVPDGTYKVTGVTLTKTYRGPGIIVLDGVNQVNDQDFVLVSGQGNRNALNFFSGNIIGVRGKSFTMGGFRLHGTYYKDGVPSFTTPNFLTGVVIDSNLPFGMSSTEPGWYAVFATGNFGDTEVTFQIMPFLRVASVASNVVSLNNAQENITTVISQTYTWTVNAMAGTEVQVINETLSSRPNAFSGRVATITANTAGTVTLDDAGGLAFGDWILPAPNNKKHYRYCGTFLYEDAGGGNEEIRNMADTGAEVRSKMSNLNAAPTGSQPSVVRLYFAGGISPLATGVLLKENSSFSTGTIGNYVSNYDSDASQHTIFSTLGRKETVPTMTIILDGITLPFSFGQETFYANGDVLGLERSGGTHEIKGWLEP